ncbi:MAG: helix-turn-helix domain-containing protein [Alphaproteobacteria bacterium]|nr:helix-turn-helix domain-containing protein [Alphaproteobacteria bacterium]
MHTTLPTEGVMRGGGALGTPPCTHCPVRNRTICSGLGPAELARVGAGAMDIRIAAGETLFTESEEARAFYTLTEGVIRLSRLLIDGRRQITDFVFPGGFFGLTVSGRYDDTAEAVTDARLCRLSRAQLLRAARELPELDWKLLELTETDLAHARDHIVCLGRRSALERIALFLVHLAGSAADGSAAFDLKVPMTREDMADYLGLTIETVSRGLAELRRRGVISLPSPKAIRVEAPRRLAVCAGLDPDMR